jgi:hypothetical protein
MESRRSINLGLNAEKFLLMKVGESDPVTFIDRRNSKIPAASPASVLVNNSLV